VKNDEKYCTSNYRLILVMAVAHLKLWMWFLVTGFFIKGGSHRMKKQKSE